MFFLLIYSAINFPFFSSLSPFDICRVSNFTTNSTSIESHDKGTLISVIGSGSFESAVARILAQVQETKNVQNNDHNPKITLYARRESIASEFNTQRTNTQYLPVVDNIPAFPNSVQATSDLVQAVKNANTIVVAVASAFLDRMLCEMKDHILPDATFVSVVKSLLEETRRTRTTVVDILTHVSEFSYF